MSNHSSWIFRHSFVDLLTGMSLLCLCWFSANGVCIMIKHLITTVSRTWVWVHILLREETFSCLHQRERRSCHHLHLSSVSSSLRSTARHQLQGVKRIVRDPKKLFTHPHILFSIYFYKLKTIFVNWLQATYTTGQKLVGIIQIFLYFCIFISLLGLPFIWKVK